MRRFEQKFTIHPIGQGLFYSGEIRVNNEVKFRMVFDCGSKTPKIGSHEINYYRDSSFDRDKVLDLLVISHFDADHVNKIKVLLGSDIKVKKLVMPFLNFEERLYLAARYTGVDGGDADDQTIEFILDPLTTLSKNFDDDTEFYYIENDPDNPTPSDEETPNDERPPENIEGRFIFGFDSHAKRVLTPDDKKQINPGKSTVGTGYKVLDSNKGKLSVPNGGMVLMDFVFYKIDIGSSEDAFYKKVKELFYAKCGVTAEDSADDIMGKILKKIKTIKGAPQIEAIFREAVDALSSPSFTINNTELFDLNTTALCMLHRNSRNIFKLIGYSDKVPYEIYNYYYNISRINILGDEHNRLVFNDFMPRYCIDNRGWHHERINKFIYPNVLLTSDSLLLTDSQLDCFFKRYRQYWDYFWLFQIPHHGSQKNADAKLFSELLDGQYNFINYDTVNDYVHPSDSVLDDLISTGQSGKTIPVNEFHGLSFDLTFVH